MEHSWSELIQRAKAEDQEAFYALYQNSYDAVYRTVKSMVKDEDAVLDIVQDSFVKGFESLSSLTEPDNFIPWMKRIAVNKAKDYFKKKHDITFSQLADDEGNEPDFEDERVENLPEAVVDRDETARLIEEILSTLSDEQRMAVGMYYYQDMSVSEIAENLGVSENTVKSRLNYGRKKIKASVEELEKRGTKLYSLAPIPFFLWLIKSQILNPAAGGAPAAAFGNIMAQAAVGGTAAAAAGTAGASASAAGAAASSTGAAAAGTASSAAASSAAASSAGAAAVGGGAAVSGNVGGGLFASLGAKIAAGVLSVSLVGGGVGTAVYLANRDGGEAPAAAETEIYDDTLFEDPSASSAEELLTRFLENVLIPERGIYNIMQPAYDFDLRFGDRVIYRSDTEYNSVSGEFKQTTQFVVSEEEYETAKETTDTSGLYFGDLYDYDGDGETELFVSYGENSTLYLELFSTEGSKVKSVWKVPCDEFDSEYEVFDIGRYSATDGKTYISVLLRRFVAEGITEYKYLRISNELQLISSLTISVNVISFYNVEASYSLFNYDTGEETQIYETDDAYQTVRDDHGNNDTRNSLIHFYDVGTDLNDFFQKYYSQDEKGAAVTLSAEELLTRYLEDELIPEKGLYDVEQPSFRGVYNQSYEEMYADYLAAKENTDISGLYFAHIRDYTGDGEPELFAAYGENDTVYLELFNIKSGNAVSTAKLSLDELAQDSDSICYSIRSLGYCHDEKGVWFFRLSNQIKKSDGSNAGVYYLISSDLKPISCLTTGLDTATEFFYDGSPGRTLNDMDVRNSIYMNSMNNGVFHIDTFLTFGTDWSPFFEKYYGKDLDQIRAQRESS